MNSNKQNLLFVGNPGSGKSTLLNSLLGGIHFKSGVSFGEGLTQHVQWIQREGVFYGDTPGLSDIKMREHAAAEITSALKNEGYFRLVFVMTLENGRVKPDDVATVTPVLQALPDVHYAIVINQLHKNIFQKLIKNTDDAQKKVIVAANCSCRPTPWIFFYPEMDELVAEDNKLHSPLPEFVNFLQQLPPAMISAAEVKNVQPKLQEKEIKELKEKLEEVHKNNERRERELKYQIEAMRKSQKSKQNNKLIVGIAGTILAALLGSASGSS